VSAPPRICPACGATNVGPQEQCLACHARLGVTLVLPRGGLPVWSSPDGTAPPLAVAAEGLEVVIVESRGEWALARFSNGWSGWLDRRRLVSRS